MVSQVSAGSSAVQGVRHLHRIHRDAEWAARPAQDSGDSARPARDGVEIGGGPVQARQSLDSLRQALTAGDPAALRGAVHAFRVHDEADQTQPAADAVPGTAAAPADGSGRGWRVHRGYEAGGHDHDRRALI